jgi:hypothetical protein
VFIADEKKPRHLPVQVSAGAIRLLVQTHRFLVRY